MTTFNELGAEFQLLLKSTLLGIDKLSTNSAKRVLKKALAHPLEDHLVKLNSTNDLENVVYEQTLEIQSIKFSMMIESLKQDAEEERIRLSREEREQRNKQTSEIPENVDIPDYAKEE